jgi:hypothetical protein
MTSLDAVGSGLRLLMTEIVDYAGLFPPARLDLPDAASRYSQYAASQDSWMLGRFVIPATRLDDLLSQESFFEGRHAPRLSVILRPSHDDLSPIDAAKADLGLVARFLDSRPERVTIDSLEMRWPSEIYGAGDVESALDALNEVIHDVLGDQTTAYLEIPWKKEAHEFLEILARAISNANGPISRFGLKVRTGGLTADLVPSAEDLSRFIATVHRHNLSFKATAGLHHPVRNEDSNVGVTMFGFFNVFCGSVLLHSGAISEEDLPKVLLEDDASAFSFDEGLAWQDAHVGQTSIRAGRDFAVSFGSCSFDEPREDLRDLGLL